MTQYKDKRNGRIVEVERAPYLGELGYLVKIPDSSTLGFHIVKFKEADFIERFEEML